MSRGGCSLMDVNPNSCEVAEHIDKNLRLIHGLFQHWKNQNPFEA